MTPTTLRRQNGQGSVGCGRKSSDGLDLDRLAPRVARQVTRDLEWTARTLDCLMASQEPDPSLTSSGYLMNAEGMMGVGGCGWTSE